MFFLIKFAKAHNLHTNKKVVTISPCNGKKYLKRIHMHTFDFGLTVKIGLILHNIE